MKMISAIVILWLLEFVHPIFGILALSLTLVFFFSQPGPTQIRQDLKRMKKVSSIQGENHWWPENDSDGRTVPVIETFPR